MPLTISGVDLDCISSGGGFVTTTECSKLIKLAHPFADVICTASSLNGMRQW